jgi:transposase
MNLKNIKNLPGYKNDILSLLESRAKGASFHKQEVTRISKKYNLPERTIYDHQNLIKKRGTLRRKKRSDKGKEKNIPEECINQIKELRQGGRSLKESFAIVESKFKIKISRHRRLKFSRQIMKEININDNNNSEFGDNLKNFLTEFFEINLIAPQKGINLKFNEVEFLLEKDEADDIILILINAYNKYAGIDKKLKLDRIELLKMKLYHLLEAQVRQAAQDLNTKDLESITRQYLMLRKKDAKAPVNFKIFENCMKELKPDITFDELYSLIKKHSNEDE